MRRLVLVALAIAGILCFTIPQAEAAIDNTSHDLTAGAQGACSTCHIPHKSLGKRLWPTSMSGQETNFGEVGSLCYYCHGTGSAYGRAVQNNIMDTTQGAYSHGLTAGDIPGGGNNMANATNLPYYDRTAIQCTSCHDVHTDTNRPFLRMSYETLCQDCHSLRSQSSGPSNTFGTWAVTMVGDNNSVGSHPIGTNISGDVSGGSSPINFNLTTFINVARSNVVDNWSLGGHLSGGAVMCGSCHAPHGVDTDEVSPSAELYAANDLLVFGQGTGSTDDGGAANGQSDANNHLCEACHTRGATATVDSSTGAAYVVTSWNVTNVGGGGTQGGTAAGTNYGKQPNPGNTAYTHPVDDLGAAGTTSVTAFPAGWPTGTTAGGNVAPAPICESCHTPHPAANNGARAAITVSTGSAILRNTAILICTDCHGASWAGHHPTGTGIMTARFNATSSTGGTIGDGNADLICGDCHGGSGGGAHNWGTMGVGIEPDWVPTNNARGANDVLGGFTGMPDNAANFSDSCKQCHMNTQGGTAHQSPTKNSADDASAVTHAWRTPVSYQDLGEGTHYIGDNVSGLYTSGWFAGSAFNATTDVWDNTTGSTGTGRGGWSRWYGKLGSVGCQSCHELEPVKNVPATALLLAWYQDGGTEAGNAANDPSAFCQGCHGQTPGGGNPHPMTGSTIGRAATAGRSSALLQTTPGGTGASTVYLATGAPTRNSGTSTFAGTDLMNCDSCHQPHDAALAGGTYIYEAPAANVTGTPGAFSGPSYLPARGSATTGLEDRAFCNQCHNY